MPQSYILARRLLAIVACLLFASPVVAQPVQTKKNIVFILADDMQLELHAHMPKLKKLVTDKGARFDNFFVSLALCCPSRASILRGQFAHNTGVYTNHWPDGSFEVFHENNLESSTVATWLHDAGYNTALIGKYMNAYPNDAVGKSYIPPGWDTWFVPNGGKPYEEYNYKINDNGTTRTFGIQPADHLNDVLLTRAKLFIQAAAPGTKPFFLYLAPYLPHEPSTPPPRYAGLFPNLKAPRPPSFNEADVSDKTRWLRRRPSLTTAQIDEIDALYRKQRQSIAAIDDMVESVIKTLEDTGELDNTYIVFASDNGFHMGEHRLQKGKSRLFEEDIHLPLVIRGPGVPAGLVVNQLVANVDLGPTFAAMGGVSWPDFVDGRSLMPLLKGRTPASWRQILLLESPTSSEGKVTAALHGELGLMEPGDASEAAEAAGFAVWPDQIFAGVRTANNNTFALYDNGDGEYYDMNTDPYQLTNTYSTMPATLKKVLTNRIKLLRTATGQTLRGIESWSLPPTP